MSFKAILDSPRPLKSGLVTVTMTCKKSDLHSIVDLMGSTVTIYGDDEKPITDSRAAILSNIRSLAEQVAEAIDRELNGCEINNDELPYNEPYRDLLTEGVKDEQE